MKISSRKTWRVNEHQVDEARRGGSMVKGMLLTVLAFVIPGVVFAAKAKWVRFSLSVIGVFVAVLSVYLAATQGKQALIKSVLDEDVITVAMVVAPVAALLIGLTLAGQASLHSRPLTKLGASVMSGVLVVAMTASAGWAGFVLFRTKEAVSTIFAAQGSSSWKVDTSAVDLDEIRSEDELDSSDAPSFVSEKEGQLVIKGSIKNEKKVEIDSPETKTPSQDKPKETERIASDRTNILLLGSDAGPGRTGVRPDTIMVLSVDKESGDAALLSLPRNLQKVRFPQGTTAEKAWPRGFRLKGDPLLNAIWSWAESRKQLFPGSSSPGLTATVWAVEETLGLNIDEWASVNMQGFIDVIDALGGVDIHVAEKLPFGRSDAPPEGWIPAGDRHMDGGEALWYARTRWGASDYSRMQRQRCVIDAAMIQNTPAEIALVAPKILAASQSHVATSITASEMAGYIDLFDKMRQGDVRSLAFTNEVIKPSNPDFDQIRQMTKDLIYPKATSPAPESAPTEGQSTEVETLENACKASSRH